jgi:hypothetical protein
MTVDTTIELHYLLKGPEAAPVLVLASTGGSSATRSRMRNS